MQWIRAQRTQIVVLCGVLGGLFGAPIAHAQPLAQSPSPGWRGSASNVLFDGRQPVPFERVDDAGRIRWGGAEAYVDEHALVWADGATDLPALATHDVRYVAQVSRALGVHRVRSTRPDEDGLALAQRLVRAGVSARAIVPDLRLPQTRHDITVPPDDPRYPGQWFYERIGIEDAWQLQDGDPSVEIVVVDNGCDEAHPDLVANLLPGRDVVDGDDTPEFEAGRPGNEHGTACAGLVAAATDNGLGVAGSCPECSVRCVRLLTDDPRGTPLSANIEAFQFALDVGADVVSNSWGFRDPIAVPPMLEAILLEVMREGRGGLGGVVVFAIGNESREVGPHELQAVEGVIAVGGTNNFDEAVQFSNEGDAVDLVAPTGTSTTDVTGADGAHESDYTSLFGGTSSSCPIVAGVAGLLLADDDTLTGAEVGEILRETAVQSFFATPDEDGHDDVYGHGVVDPLAALLRVRGVEPTPDAGPTEEDAGSMPDAGSPDAGAAPMEDGGCGCRATRSGPAALGLVALVLFARRRHR